MICRHCKNSIKESFLDLGSQPLANSLLTKYSRNKKEPKYPLKVYFCNKCFLVQIDKVVHQKKIFNKTYPYFSSYSNSWLEHAKKYSNYIVKKLKLDNKSFVIELASNDGYLLQNFKKKKISCLGIEPTKNTASIAKSKGIETITKFFSSDLAKKIITRKKNPDLIIANNVLAHVPNLNDFIKGLEILTNNKTVITVEFPHLMQLIMKFQYDTIYHEHFSYFSLLSLVGIFKKFNLKIFDVQEIDTHGGSLRIFISNKKSVYKVSKSVDILLKKEIELKLNKKNIYINFSKKVASNRKQINKFLLNCKKNSKVVVAYGAAAKGNTLLNYCKIKPSLVKQVYDLSPHKQNKLMPGSRIPISDPKFMIDLKPDYIIFLPWNLKKELIKQLSHNKSYGANFVTFIPEINIF